MEINISYTDALERCKTLSSFEGRNAVSGSGDSEYLKIKVNTQDETLVKTFIQQGAHTIEARLGKCVVTATYSDTGVKYILKSYIDKWHEDNSLSKSIFEAICSFAMFLWLSYNSSDRADSYNAVYTDMAEALVLNTYRRPAPIKKKKYYPKEESIVIK